jgi:hypothetical protein
VLPPSVQEEVARSKAPIAATFRLTFPDAPEPPFVLRSTTTISIPAAAGTLGVKGITPAPVPGEATAKVTVLEKVPSGFCICTARFPADCRSAADREVVHSTLDAQDDVRDVPVTQIAEPGPGLEATKLFPEISSVKPPAEPAYALAGARAEILGPPEMFTVAVADWVTSSALVATISIRFGVGAVCGAIYSPVASMEPQAPELPHPTPVTFQVTC